MTTNAATRLGIVLVTAGSEPEATALAGYLVENRLAACVSITPIQSVYTWKEKIQTDQEWQLVIKTDLNRFDDLAKAITQRHSYEVPGNYCYADSAGVARLPDLDGGTNPALRIAVSAVQEQAGCLPYKNWML